MKKQIHIGVRYCNKRASGGFGNTAANHTPGRGLMRAGVFAVMLAAMLSAVDCMAQTASLQTEQRAEGEAALSMQGNTTPLEEILNPDGTLNLDGNFTGSVDVTGWRMHTDESGEPHFSHAQPNSLPASPDDNWSALGSGTNGQVYALAISGSDVYAGGYFTYAGGVSANRIAKWDGTSWSALGSGMNSIVNALAINGSNVYAGGWFTVAGGHSANHIAKWDGTSWSALGSGIMGDVLALAVSGSDVYAGGFFTMAGGASANRIAKWNGTSWSALGSGMNNRVLALAISGSDVYAGGQFTMAGGVPASYVAKWDGTSWSALGSGLNEAVHALAVNGSDVYAGGWFTVAGGHSANHIAKWNGTRWSALGSGMNHIVLALATRGSEVYAGGWFSVAGGVFTDRIAKWDGTSWSALGSGINYGVYALAKSGSDVYAGGGFTKAGNKPAHFVALWTAVVNTPPSITCPANIAVSAAPGLCSETVIFAVSATGIPAPTVVCTPASGTAFLVGTTTVNCTATNSEGSASCSFTVTVNDIEPPSITCPANMVVNPTSLSGAIVTYTTPIGSDNCSGASTAQTAGLASGSAFPIGITTNTFVVTDASSNIATCSFTIEVRDPTCDPNKVYVCHNGTSICVSVNSLQAHLGHGDNLGECGWYPKMNTESYVTLPTTISLEQNHPNPFTTSSEIRYTIANDAHVLLRMFDLFGREVKTIVNAQQQKGSHNVTIDGHNLSGGMYIYRLDANGEARTGRMMLVR